MKVGILTFHCAHNYGAVLQCYATQEFLRGKGFDVEIINYRPKYLWKPYRVFARERFIRKNLFLSLKLLIVEFWVLYNRCKRFRGFEKFINKRLNLGKVVTNIKLPFVYDAYIVGSDQVWNPKLTHGFDPIYFAHFPFPKGDKRYISYAASMEAKSLSDEQVEFFKKNLCNFDSLSVREDALLQLLQPLTSKHITHVLDPVLMVSPQIWDSFSSDKKSVEKYVAVYQVRNHPDTLRIAHHIAAQIGAKVRVLVAGPVFRPVEGTNQTSTPEDFVDTIRNAACVVTTSFHGTAFSVVFNRPFYTVQLNDGWDTRSQSLLVSLGLEDRIVDVTDSPQFAEVDYLFANQKLEELRCSSQEYLLNAL